MPVAPVAPVTTPSSIATWKAVRAGTLRHASGRWEFTYDLAYLESGREAWEIDPTWLRVKQRSPFVHMSSTPPGVFSDIAVSGWSLDLARRQLAGTVDEWGWWERITLAPADGFGAIFVGDESSKPDLSSAARSELGEMEESALDAIAIESSSGAMGGERPKFAARLFGSRGQPNRAVILKFAAHADPPDCVVAEATALTLATRLGLDVPWHAVMMVNNRPALCIERFDRPEGGTYMHCVSAATALAIPYASDTQDPKRSYVALRSKLKKPGDGLELFRRIVLNAVVGNSDDHPWNHSLCQAGAGQWNLSPLYDVMPFLHRIPEPVFSMAITRAHQRQATIANLLRSGREIAALDVSAARREIERVCSVVKEHWSTDFARHAENFQSAKVERWKGAFECFARATLETDQPDQAEPRRDRGPVA